MDKAIEFIWFSDQIVDGGDHGTLILTSISGLDMSEWETLDEDGSANVGGNEHRETRSKSISFEEEFIKEQDDEAWDEELTDDEEGSELELLEWSVHSWDNTDYCLNEGEGETKYLLGSLEELSILFALHVDFDDSNTGEQLKEESGTNKRCHS